MPSAARCRNPKLADLSGGVPWVSQSCGSGDRGFGGGSVHVVHGNLGSVSSVSWQPLWAGSESPAEALGPCLSGRAAGRGSRGSILDALWKRDEPGCKSPQKLLFQSWWPTSAPITSKERVPSLLGGSQPPAPPPAWGRNTGQLVGWWDVGARPGRVRQQGSADRR